MTARDPAASALAASSDYAGDELPLFLRATNWKHYLAKQIKPFLGDSVIEVGSGIGANVPYLFNAQSHWLCVEPDRQMAEHIRSDIRDGMLPAACSVANGTLSAIPAAMRASSIIYIDVLEHIEDDAAEMMTAASHLHPGGHLIVLSPSSPWLYSPFDAAIGHYRRYTAADYRRLTPPELKLVTLRHLDSVGMAASAANKLLLKAAMPTEKQVLFWDRALVPVSRVLDPLVGHTFGKSLLGIWTTHERSGIAKPVA